MSHGLAKAIEARSGETGTGLTGGKSAVASSHSPGCQFIAQYALSHAGMGKNEGLEA